MISPHSHSAEKDAGAVSHTVKRRVFIVDEHPICRHGMAQLINSEPDLVVCGEAESPAQALAALRAIQAELAIVDVSPQSTEGLEFVQKIRTEHPETTLLATSTSDESLFALGVLRAGAKGYLMKREGLHQYIAAIRKVLGGQIYLNPTFGEQLIAQLAHGKEPASSSPIDRLTEREKEVLRLLGTGQPTKRIAETLRLSHKTIESHRLHIKEKLGIASAPELVRFASHWVTKKGG